MRSDILINRFEAKYPAFDFLNYDCESKKFKVKCRICKSIFLKSKESFYKNYGCKFCKGKEKMSFEKFQEIFFKICAPKQIEFLFSKRIWLKEYKNSRSKLYFRCKKCNKKFKTTINGLFYQKSGCPHCASEKKAQKLRLTYSDFLLKDSSQLYEYLFDKDWWTKNFQSMKKTRINIKCKKCTNIFAQTVDSHLRGHGCPFCKQSKGEQFIRDFLIKNNIKFIAEKHFPGCENYQTKGKLRFDFYLPDQNILIEFDGIQHFKPISYKNFNFLKIKENDKLKETFCKKNNLPLYRLHFELLKDSVEFEKELKKILRI